MAEILSKVWLKEIASGAPREAILCESIQARHLSDVEGIWKPAWKVLLRWSGREEQSSHWDWRAKLRALRRRRRSRTFAVECDGITQGLMIIELGGRCRVETQRGQELVYIDFLEVAPWNRDSWKPNRLYGSVGTALIRSAIQASVNAGYQGKIGLHSLPQADNFYCRLGMLDLGRDSSYDNLRYFEMTSAQATKLQQDKHS